MGKKLYFLAISFVLPVMGMAQLLPTFGNSRTGASGMQFLKIAPDARSTALAGSVVGNSFDAAAMFWNPSGLAAADSVKLSAVFSNTRYTAASSANFAGVSYRLGSLSYLGVQVISMNYAPMEETTEFQPYGTGRMVNLNNTLLGLTYSRILTENFCFGISSKFAHEAIGDVAVNNVLFDLGLTYNIGIKHARFGVTFTNFGLNVSPSGEVNMLNLNGETVKTSFGEVSAPGMFRLGGAFDPIHNQFHSLTLSAQLNHPTDNNESFSAGAEYAFRRFLYGRAGYEFGSDEKYNLPTLGLGMRLPRKFGNAGLDLSMVSKQRMGNMYRVSLMLNLF
ncbi:hypothetical protein MASR2M44_29520 [Bacteroidota bacterium]